MAETIAFIGTALLTTVGASEAFLATTAGTVLVEALGTAVVSATLYAGSTFLTPGPSLSPSQQKQNFRQSVTPRRQCYGRVKIGGPLFFLEVRNAPNLNKPGNDGQLFSGVLLGSHKFDGIEQYWLGDALVTLDGSNLVNEAPFYLEGWRRAKLVFKDGSDSQTAHSDLTSVFPGEWASGDRLRGIANILGRFGSLEDKAFTKAFPNGVPIMNVLARTAQVWDPSDSGQDPDDKDTFTFTTNGPRIVMDYVWSERGMRLPRELVELALDDWIDKINAAEEQVALSEGGTEDRFQLSGVYDLTSPPRDVLPLMLEPMGANLRMRGDGAIVLDLPDYYEPTVILTDDHIISYTGLRRSPEVSDMKNEIRATYLSPQHGYEEQEAAPWRFQASIDIDGVQSETLNLSWCPSHAQAQRRQKLEAFRRNPNWVGVIVTNAYGLDSMGERLIRVQISELGLDIVCERTSFSFDPATGRCAIGIRHMPEFAFTWDAEEGDAPEGGVTEPDEAPDAPYALAVVLETSGAVMHFNISYEEVTHGNGFYAQWSSYIPGQDEDEVVWNSIVSNQYPSPAYVQKDVAGNGVSPIRVRAWFQTPAGVKSEYAYDIIDAETTGAPASVVYFTATGGVGSFDIEFEAPASANFSYVLLFKSAAADPFSSAIQYSSNIYAAPGEVVSRNLTSFDYGTFRLWAVAYSGAGVASTEVGPQLITVDAPVMGDIATEGATAFRDFNTDGYPPSGLYRPQKSLIRSTFATIDTKFDEYRIAAYAREFGVDQNGDNDSTDGILDLVEAIGSGNFESTPDGTHGLGWLPAGNFKTSANIPLPGSAVLGGVFNRTVIRPQAGVTKGIIQAGGSGLCGVAIYGVDADDGIIGLAIGNEGPLANAGFTRDVVVAGFGGSGGSTGRGLKLGFGVRWEFTNLICVDNYTGAWIEQTGEGAPTAVTFRGCQFVSNDGRGLIMRTGQGVRFDTCVFELNGLAGTYLSDTAGNILSKVTFDNCWWEANHQGTTIGAARHVKYQHEQYAKRVMITNSFFNVDTSEARSCDFERCGDSFFASTQVPDEAGQIRIQNDSGNNITFGHWPESNGDITNVVDDQSPSGTARYFIPTALTP